MYDAKNDEPIFCETFFGGTKSSILRGDCIYHFLSADFAESLSLLRLDCDFHIPRLNAETTFALQLFFDSKSCFLDISCFWDNYLEEKNFL